MKKLDDIIDDWRSTFGCHELEQVAKSVVGFLKSDKPSSNSMIGLWREGLSPGWDKRFGIEDVTENCDVFAAMATLGYFEHVWFPKWCFTVTEKFIERCPTQPYEERK
jgi:hypothetical protein